uniref:Minor tail protein n=1 Tax=Myoviridae sp. ctjhW4 TaxID=2825162 RepID=A0A8S5PR70_9CAUD|nr:MAG TPA: minor tail protein [Myoviridae sp. ctjhW4]
MDRFAKKANAAAKELRTTTTDYTNASLIFYQQGLSDEAVKERTDTTIKMANVTKDSAEEVSSYMTAIWNNFDDGSRSLESYADTITALGAATASSSAEIAAGLEKFASVADQIGLSYNYATSALATVVAQTRQSEDVVGTAFKTIFARIQGLNLGETQEDGTTLNQYSEALSKVGVNIKDTMGQVKDMDTILDETGAKW